MTTVERGHGRYALLSYVALAGCAVAWFLYRERLFLELREFGDESTNFVAARMIVEGGRLYDSVFSHHGPLPYLLAYVAALIGARTLARFHLIMPLLYLVPVVAAALSTAWRETCSRLAAPAALLLLIAGVTPVWSGHMLLYQNVAGILFVAFFALVLLPLATGAAPSRAHLGCGGIALGLLPATGYPFAPCAALLLAATICLAGARARGRLTETVAWILGGAALSIAGVLGWVIRCGTLEGLYRYHFLFNQRVYANYIAFTPWAVVRPLTLPFAADPEARNPINAALLATVLVAFADVVAVGLLALSRPVPSDRSRRRGARVIASWLGAGLFGAALLSLNPRGEASFHAAAFYFAAIAICTLLLVRVLVDRPRRSDDTRHAGIVVAGTLLAVAYMLGSSRYAVSPIDTASLKAHTGYDRLENSAHIRLVRALTEPADHVIFWSYRPADYLFADRLPAIRDFYFLPWQAAFEGDEASGRVRSTCNELESAAPKVMVFDYWKVWGSVPFEQYAGCEVAWARAHYAECPVGDVQVYVRPDLVTTATAILRALDVPESCHLPAASSG